MKKIPFRMIWGFFMAFAYIGIAYVVVFTPFMLRYNAANDPEYDQHRIIRILLGAVLFIYGIFRGYRMWKTIK